MIAQLGCILGMRGKETLHAIIGDFLEFGVLRIRVCREHRQRRQQYEHDADFHPTLSLVCRRAESVPWRFHLEWAAVFAGKCDPYRNTTQSQKRLLPRT